ncbi:hypothetical protein [Mycolicibacterium mengxianglii]|uniref:hypothetical protein n=1 Tax=Mycolicibacterium mengxianglii TaxID=2736649 RepID=UPI0018EF106E|nr:hypothetical protein [Mycolicibacterium mengxianglii]
MWTGIADDIAPRVQEVLGQVDQCCDTPFDAEYRSACGRLQGRAAFRDPRAFRRKSEDRNSGGLDRMEHQQGQ